MAVSRARTLGLVYAAWIWIFRAARAEPAARACSRPRSVRRRSASGRASCGSASPWRRSQSCLAIDRAGYPAYARVVVPWNVVPSGAFQASRHSRPETNAPLLVKYPRLFVLTVVSSRQPPVLPWISMVAVVAPLAGRTSPQNETFVEPDRLIASG